MALIEWRDEFETGIEFLDYEHRRLVGLINELFDRQCRHDPEITVSDCFGRLHARIVAHFALEENLMREKRYDNYAEHKAEHERLLEEFREIMDRYEDGAYSCQEEALAEHPRDWFVQHFETVDPLLKSLDLNARPPLFRR